MSENHFQPILLLSAKTSIKYANRIKTFSNVQEFRSHLPSIFPQETSEVCAPPNENYTKNEKEGNLQRGGGGGSKDDGEEKRYDSRVSGLLSSLSTAEERWKVLGGLSLIKL